MIRNLLATTAIATLLATSAFAQDTTAPAAPAPTDMAPAEPAPLPDAATSAVITQGNLATQIIGESVYNGPKQDAQKIGNVNDIVIGPDGVIQSVVVGVGGFLGIGEKNVAVDLAQIEWAELNGDRWLVTPVTKEQLETQAAFDRSAYEPAQPSPDSGPVAQTDPGQVGIAPTEPDVTADAPLSDEPMDQMTQEAAPVPESTAPETTAAIDKSTLTAVPDTEIRAEEMIGTTVYGADDAEVGAIGDVVLSADGKIDAFVVDVGGFLGIGAKEVAIGSDNLAFMKDADGDRYLYTSFSKEQLDAAAAYDKATYTEKRNDQRLILR